MGAPSSTVTCGQCGAANRAGAKFCRGCGGSLAADLICAGCGASNPPDGRFCDECGSALRGTEPTPLAAPTAASAVREEFAGGRYRVIRLLGEGGRKRVYLAEDTRLRREVAIGTFKAVGLDEKGLARARREAEAMAQLSDHPNIVPIYDIAEEGPELYIVSQYMAGGDLSGMLDEAQTRQLTVEEAVRIGIEVAGALEHAHAHGVVHRDVKPGNVWLAPDGTAKLGDFGLAMALDGQQLTVEGSTVGTVAYMSPEQGLGQAASPRSDLYSLGALIYELLCGVPPFTGGDAAAVIAQHVSRTPVGPTWHRADVPRGLENVVLRMLAKSPDERPADALEVREALATVAEAGTREGGAEELVLERLTDGGFIGRDSEMRDLRGAVDEALAGRGCVALVVGDAGIGKTALAVQLDTYAELRGATVVWGRSTGREGAPAYWPWIQAIRAYVRGLDAEHLRAELGSGASDVAQIVSEVRERLPDIGEHATLDAEQARFRLFDSITTLLLNASRRTPLVLVLDDLHLADRPSVLLLEFLAAEIPSARVLVLGTYRDADLDAEHPLNEISGSLARGRGYRRLRLGGLAEDDIRALIEATAQQSLTTPDELALLEAVTRVSEGNPYFIGEIVRDLLESGAVYRSGDRWVSDARRIEDLRMPQGMRDAVGRSLARLAPECRDALAVASVIGREFSLTLLERLTGLEPADLMAVLQEGMDEGVIDAVTHEAGGYQFAQLATREALYDTVSKERRAELHRAIGEALEDLYESRIESHLGELAHHFAEAAPAGTSAKAADYAWWAGEHAIQLYAYEDAVNHFTRALALFGGEDDPARRCELRLVLGDALWRAGATEEAERKFLEVAELAKDAGLAEHFARAALGYGGGPGGFSVANRAKESLIELLRDALDLMPKRDSLLRVKLIARLAVETYLYADTAEPDELSRQAVEMADRIGDARLLLLAIYSRQWAITGPDDLDEKLDAADEIVRLARLVSDQEMEFQAQHLRLNALLQQGRIEDVDAAIRACTRLAKDLRQPRYDWQVAVFRAMRALLQGRFKEGMRLAEAALAIGQQGVGDVALVSFGAQAFASKWTDGTLHDLREGGASFAETYSDSAWPSAFTWLLCEIDDLEEAQKRFEAISAAGFDALRRDFNWLTAMATLTLTAHYLADKKASERLYEMLVPYADEHVPILAGAGSLGSVHFFLGHAALAAGRLTEGVHHLETAIEANAAVGIRIAHPRGYRRIVETLIALGESERAGKALELGIEASRKLGATAELEALTALRLEGTALAGAPVDTSIEVVRQSVEADLPDLRPAAAPDGAVTILFSDIEDSTRLTQTVGDRRWLELLDLHNQIVRDSLVRHGGYEVKSIGDGFMLAFASAAGAINCAVDVQRGLAQLRSRDQVPLRVRIGLHSGEVTRRKEDFFGTNVNLAARVGGVAEGDQILVSSTLHDLVAGIGEFEFGEEREVELKGFAERHRVFEVPWQP